MTDRIETTALLPCPFCGGQARHTTLFERNGVFVRCDGCEVLMMRLTWPEVASAWNRRIV